MTLSELIETYPRLWHMAQDGSWPAIRDGGLLSTAALLERYGVTGARRDELLRARRPEAVPLTAAGLPGALLRDQKPLNDRALGRCLENGLTPADWYEVLNRRCFFWLSRERVWRLIGARAYRGMTQTVLTIETRGLVAGHRERIGLSPINSGATIFGGGQPRGTGTFVPVADFPFAARSATRKAADNVVELVVEHAVPDIRDHVLAVHRVAGRDRIEPIWRSPRAADGDHP